MNRSSCSSLSICLAALFFLGRVTSSVGFLAVSRSCTATSEAYRDVNLSEDSRMPLGDWLDRWLEEYVSPAVRESTCRSRGLPESFSYLPPPLQHKHIPHFALGFRLGVRLMAECMDENDGDIRTGGE